MGIVEYPPLRAGGLPPRRPACSSGGGLVSAPSRRAQENHAGQLRAAEILTGTLARLWGRYAQAYRQLNRPQPARSAVHDLRVAARRLQAALRLAEACAGVSVHSLRGELRATQRRLGAVRDAEVHAAKLRELAGRYPSVRALRRTLVRSHAQGLAAVRSELPLGALQRQTRAVGRLSERLRQARRGVSMALAPQVRRLLARQRRRLRNAIQHRPRNDPATLHRLRVALKGQRYLLELAALHFPDVFLQPLLDEARLWQTDLGEIQDWHTLAEIARGFALHTAAAVAPAALSALDRRCREAISLVTRRRRRLATFVEKVAALAALLHRP